MSRRRKRARRLAAVGGLSTASVAILHAGVVPSPAAATAQWTQVQHNIQGTAHGASLYQAEAVISEIRDQDPILATLNEVCQGQADYVYNSLISRYHIWMAVAHPSIPECGSRPFGNMLLINKSASYDAEPQHFGYGPAGYYQNYTKIFGAQWSTRTPKEHKRIDCAAVTGGTTASQKFKACTTHLVTAGTGDPGAQMASVRDNSEMNAPSLISGDLNLERPWIASNVNNWRWDHTSSSPPKTTANRKIDWVLGRTDYDFQRVAASQVGVFGINGFESDHRILVSFLRAV